MGSGSTYYYNNLAPATPDTYSFNGVCNTSTVSAVLNGGASVEVCSSQPPSGIAATTVLVDKNWNVSGSCDTIYPRTYRISSTSNPIGASKNVFINYVNADSMIWNVVVGTGTQTVDIISYTFPTFNRLERVNTPTITDLGPYIGDPAWPSKSANLFKNQTKKVRFEIGAASRTATSSYRFLDQNNKLIDFTYSTNVNTNGQYQHEVIASTLPVQYSFTTGSFAFVVANQASNLPISNCYTYSLYSECGKTFNYVDCNNVSSSIVVPPDGTATICAKANSIPFTTTALNCTDLVLIVGAC